MSVKVSEDLRTWDAWRSVHQPFELNWWREHLAQLDDPGFTQHWDRIKQFVKPHGLVLDIGCGPRPPFAPGCAVIEPLANDYRLLVPQAWWDSVVLFAAPAEQYTLALANRFDTLVAWNCLDHTIGWREILRNMSKYGSMGARYVVATDFWPPFTGHPGFERSEFMAEVEKYFIITEQSADVDRELAMVMIARP